MPFIISGGLLIFCALAAAIVLDPSEELRQSREDEVEGEGELERDIRDGARYKEL